MVSATQGCSHLQVEGPTHSTGYQRDSRKPSPIDTSTSSWVSVSLGNSKLEVFILMWSLKLEGGGSHFRERTGWRRKAQRKTHGGVKFVFEDTLQRHVKPQRRIRQKLSVQMDVTLSPSRICVLKTESGHQAPCQLEERGQTSPPGLLGGGHSPQISTFLVPPHDTTVLLVKA